MGRGDLMVVTGSILLLYDLRGCFGVSVLLSFEKIALRSSYGTELREDVTVV